MNEEAESSFSNGSLIPGIPNEIALTCIARVPRSNHPYLHLVSRSWRSLLRSHTFYDVRSQLSSSVQPFIYITVRPFSSSSFQWLLIDPRAPNPKRLHPFPPPPFSSTGSSCAVLGPRIFVLGGSVSDVPSSTVWIFDARFNRWEIGPSMRVSREFSAAGALDGKIYVLGGCLADSFARSSSWAEVLDPAAGSWSPVPSPVDVQEKWMHSSAVLGGKLFAMADRGGVIYDPAASAWTNVSTELDLGWRGRAAAVDGILYCYDNLGKIRGYDEKEDKWEELKGIEKELPKFLYGATLADLGGGRLFVAWEGKGRGKDMEIGCAEIETVRESGGGLRGSIVWSDIVNLAVPRGSTIVNCLAVGL